MHYAHPSDRKDRFGRYYHSGDVHPRTCPFCRHAKGWASERASRAFQRPLPFILYHSLRPGTPATTMILLLQILSGADPNAFRVATMMGMLKVA